MYPLSPHALALGSPVRMNLYEALLLPQKRARGAVGGGREEGERIRENYWQGKQRWNKIVRQKSSRRRECDPGAPPLPRGRLKSSSAITSPRIPGFSLYIHTYAKFNL